MKRYTYKLLTDQASNPKTAKAQDSAYLTAILHLAPARLSGKNLCARSTKGCREACLNTAGRGGINGADNNIQRRRIARSHMFLHDRESFQAQLIVDLIKLSVYATKIGKRPAVRLNGTSDIGWERIKVPGFRNIMEAFPNMIFYDYTKHTYSKRPPCKLPHNYFLTFSRAENNHKETLDSLSNGRNVCVVFGVKKDAPLPTSWNGYAVIDGDLSDLRFLDRTGVVVGVRAKGKAKKDISGFVVH